ncbi:MAG: low molecular weight phosphotyrosine protein phosphatase [Gallionella sp.]|nr:low molecular weight phosphotyrosine protein phosphatase [Gallionella sp.]
MKQIKSGVLFVCMGNICRSPTAEEMFRSKAIKAGIAPFLVIDSAGTHDYHVGAAPDSSAQLAAKKRGYDLSALRARQVSRHDLERFDYILAMDINNLTVLHHLGGSDLWQKPKLMMSYSNLYKGKEVPDPYRGDIERFDLVLDMLESATDGLLQVVKQGLQPNVPAP